MKARRLASLVLLALAATAWAAPGAPTTAAAGETAAPATSAPAAATPAEGDVSADSNYLSYAEPGPPEPPGLLSLAGRVIGSLAVVTGLIVVTGLVLRRYVGGSKAPTTSRKVSELVEVTPLGGKRYLYLIRVADRLLVVGAGGDRLSLLSEIRDPEVLAQVAAQPRRSEFFDLFSRVSGHRPGADAPQEAGADRAVAG